MIAVDTNLLVRLLTKDDLSQAKRAARIMESEDIFIPKTVIFGDGMGITACLWNW